MDISQGFGSDPLFHSNVFEDVHSTNTPIPDYSLDNDIIAHQPPYQTETEEKSDQQRIKELQEKIQVKQQVLSMNRSLQNQLLQQLSVVDTLLSNAQKSSYTASSDMPISSAQPMNDSDEESLRIRKESTHRLLLSFPPKGSLLYFSRRKKSYPRFISSSGIPLTFLETLDQIHIQHWSTKDEEKLAKLVLSQCQQLIAVDGLSSSLRTNAEIYLSSSDTYEKTMAFHNLLPSLINQFSWETIAYELGHSTTDCFLHWVNYCDPFINATSWSIDEDASLKELAEKYHEHNWVDISKDLNTGRTPYQCFERYVSTLEMKDYNLKWTPEDDALILEGIKRYGTKSWKKVSESIPNRSWEQCRSRYYQALLQKVKKGHWSQYENSRLLLFLFFYGINDWTTISKRMVTRNSSQCRDRWYNVLNPTIVKGKWTMKDNMKLLKLTSKKDQIVWKTICKHFPGRTADACKTQYHNLTKNTRLIVCFIQLFFFSLLV